MKRRAGDAASAVPAKRRAQSEASSADDFSSYDVILPPVLVAPAGATVTEKDEGAAQKWLAAQCFQRTRNWDSQTVKNLLGVNPTQGGYVVPDDALQSLRAMLPLVSEDKVLKKSVHKWTLLVYGHNDEAGHKFTPYMGLEAVHARGALLVPTVTGELGTQCTTKFGHKPSKMGVCTFCGTYASNASSLCNHIRNVHWSFSVSCMRCGRTTTSPYDWAECVNAGSGRKGFLDAHRIAPEDFGPFDAALVQRWYAQSAVEDEAEVAPNSYIFSKKK